MKSLRQILDDTRGDPAFPSLFLGQEILARHPEDLRHVAGRGDVGLAGSSALLVEFGFDPGFDGEGVIRYARSMGRTIVVAHPERYAYGETSCVERVRRWRALGARIQLNGGSLLGLYTARAWALARELLREGMVDMVCSDHHGHSRPHSPAQISEAIAEELGPPAAEVLMGSNPRQILSSRGTGSEPQAKAS